MIFLVLMLYFFSSWNPGWLITVLIPDVSGKIASPYVRVTDLEMYLLAEKFLYNFLFLCTLIISMAYEPNICVITGIALPSVTCYS